MKSAPSFFIHHYYDNNLSLEDRSRGFYFLDTAECLLQVDLFTAFCQTGPIKSILFISLGAVAHMAIYFKKINMLSILLMIWIDYMDKIDKRNKGI